MKAFKLSLISVMLLALWNLSAFAQVNHWETVVFEDDNWSYLVPSKPVPASWNTIPFDASGWLIGKGGFGYEDGDDNTILDFGTLSVFQRIEFTIVDKKAIASALLNIDYDDGFVAYLNGHEIARELLITPGQPSWNQLTTAPREAIMYSGGLPAQYIVSKEFLSVHLVEGKNVLCVQTHNASPGSTDLSSRVFLSLAIKNESKHYRPTPAWFDVKYSNLPIIVIHSVSTINKEVKVAGKMGIIHNDSGENSLIDNFNEYYGDIAIKLRGSSSGTFPKKAYKLETRKPDSSNFNVSIFDFPVDNDWILYAPYADKSLIRNVLTYKIGEEMGHYSPRTQLVELYLNNDYVGVYVFTEKIKQNKGRVDVGKLKYSDTEGDALTGGYVFKLDRGTTAWSSPYPQQPPAAEIVRFQMQDPKLKNLHPTQLNYIKNYVTDFEHALFSPDFMDPVLGYRPFIDINSFIDFILVNEMTGNLDAYRVSTYFHKQRDSKGGKLVAGPIWDFNLGWGNVDFCEAELITGWRMNSNSYCYGDGEHYVNRWWSTLLSDPSFSHDMNCRWQMLRMTTLNTDSILSYIDKMEIYLKNPAARNFERWPILGTYVWPNNYVGETYADEMNYFGEWMTARLEWMDANMFGECPDLNIADKEVVSTVRVYPNPSQTNTTVLLNETISTGRIELINHLGQTFNQLIIDNQSQIDVDLSQLAPGLYILRIFNEEQLISIQKIIRN